MGWQAEYEGSGEQWNVPTSALLAPGQSLAVGWRFHLASSIRGRDAALAGAGLAVVQGIPGMAVPYLEQCLCMHAGASDGSVVHSAYTLAPSLQHSRYKGVRGFDVIQMQTYIR